MKINVKKRAISIVLCIALLMALASTAVALERDNTQSRIDYIHNLLEASGVEREFVDPDDIPPYVEVITFESIDAYLAHLESLLEMQEDIELAMEHILDDISEFYLDSRSIGGGSWAVASQRIGNSDVTLRVSVTWASGRITSAVAYVTHTHSWLANSNSVDVAHAGIRPNHSAVDARASGNIITYIRIPGVADIQITRAPWSLSGTLHVFNDGW